VADAAKAGRIRGRGVTVAEWDSLWQRYWRAYSRLFPSLPWMTAQQRALPGMVKQHGERPKAPDDALWLLLVDAIRIATVGGAIAQLPAPLVAALKEAVKRNSSSPLAPVARKLINEGAQEVGMDLLKALLSKLPGKLKTYLPVIAVLVIAGQIVAQLLGAEGVVAALRGVGGLIDVNSVAPVGTETAIVAVVAAAGAAYKAGKLLWVDILKPLLAKPSA
jgi:hypothetical protein